MPGAIDSVDGVLAQVDSGAATAREAIELVPKRSSHCVTTERGRCRATSWRPAIGVVLGAPTALGDPQGTLALVNRASRRLLLVSLPRSARQEEPRAARFSLPRPPGGEGGRGRRRATARVRCRVTPPIGRRPVSEVNTADVLEILTAVWHVKAETPC